MSELLNKANEYERLNKNKVDEQRPLFHLTGGVGWINDPNGFSFYKDEYHMFYQYYPFDTYFGPMFWGHAVSKDLLNWTHKGAVMAPDTFYDEKGCFSGTAIQIGDQHALFYTGVDGNNNQQQAIAFGDGRTYSKYENNPVISLEEYPPYISYVDCRDPKIWKEGYIYYTLVVGMHEDGHGRMLLYKSLDCLKWTFVSIFFEDKNLGEMWECPDYFTYGDKDVVIVNPCKMVATKDEYHGGFNTIIFVGKRDREKNRFIPESSQNIDYGLDFYAPQSILDQKGRRILMAWMANWSSAKYKKKDALYFGAMCLPREMKYNGSRWIQGPIEEFNSYRDKEINKDLMVSDPVQIEGISGRIFDLNLSFKNQKGLKFTIECAKKEDHSFVIEYNEENNTLSLDRSFDGNCVDILHTRKKTLFSKNESANLRIIMDTDYIEIFVNDGEDAFSARTFAPKENTDISFSSNLETLTKIKFYTLKK